ncbi:NUDIX hydrolase [Paenisporosarcina quisquiliarum]|uniref:NUDIX hydrolase n=1 Tax=Paenisporosarcina quisquiliarum TaxID=365346 RepID=A0A9X3RDZ9_9BACL|nr:NUDIX hydrolase [Paenisporosarcina quisquiliarum]MCZ8536838.1 NUDIX hydrolase [Paenisporosarcina quisquiliarum]
MFQWKGAAGVCINEENQVLMVLQAAPDEEPKWTVPSGGIEGNETYEEACMREFEEETGLTVEIVSKLQDKNGMNAQYGISYDIQYFLVKRVSGELTLQDPDEFILEIAWKSADELDSLELSYPEDVAFLKGLLVKAIES